MLDFSGEDEGVINISTLVEVMPQNTAQLSTKTTQVPSNDELDSKEHQTCHKNLPNTNQCKKEIGNSLNRDKRLSEDVIELKAESDYEPMTFPGSKPITFSKPVLNEQESWLLRENRGFRSTLTSGECYQFSLTITIFLNLRYFQKISPKFWHHVQQEVGSFEVMF